MKDRAAPVPRRDDNGSVIGFLESPLTRGPQVMATRLQQDAGESWRM